MVFSPYHISISGLILKLNVEQSQYLPFVTSSTGVVVLVHMPDKKPYEREEGIVVSPGFSTEIVVTIVSNDG